MKTVSFLHVFFRIPQQSANVTHSFINGLGHEKWAFRPMGVGEGAFVIFSFFERVINKRFGWDAVKSPSGPSNPGESPGVCYPL
jgi:hypothetical protein